MGADAGLVSWSSLSGAPPDGVRPSLGSAVTSAASSQWRTSRPPRKAQLTGCAECWTRRRRQGADGGAEWRCQLASLWQATRMAGECPDPQQVGRESLDGEEWEPPELLDGDGGDGDGEEQPSRRRHHAGTGVGISPPTGGWMLSPYQPPTGGWTGWRREVGSGGESTLRRSGGDMRRTALSLGARGESYGRREQVRCGGSVRRGERAEGGTGGAWIRV